MGNSLDELAKRVGVDLSEKKAPKKNTNKFVARRRRGWIDESDEEIKQEATPAPVKKELKKTKQKKILTSKVKSGQQDSFSLSFTNLRGNPLSLICYLHERASSRNFITEKITQLEVIDTLNISRESARTALRFLLKNSLIARVEFQAGRAGWSVYSIDKKLFEEITVSKLQNANNQ